MEREQKPIQKENKGKLVRNLGIVGGILGLLFSSEALLTSGIGLAVGGEIFSRVRHYSKQDKEMVK